MKRIISLFLVFAMLLSTTPLTVFAQAPGAADQTSLVFDTAQTYEVGETPIEFVSGEPSEVPMTETIPGETRTQPKQDPTAMPEKIVTEIVRSSVTVSVAAISAEGYTYTVLDDSNCEITGYSGTETVLVIPSELDGYAVQRIGYAAFSGKVALTEVTLPEGLTTIYSRAFDGCTGLTSIDIPDSVTTMSATAFRNCTNLAEVGYPVGWTTTLSSLDRSPSDPGSDEYASPFTGCTALKTIEVPEGVTFIPSNAFRSCPGLDQIVLPESLERIDAYAFNSCANLKEISLPEGLTTIGAGAFRNCTALQEVILPESITSLGDYAFQSCTGLTGITLNDGLSSMGSHVFNGCTALTGIAVPGTITKLDIGTFAGCTGLSRVSLPEGLTAIYSRAFDGCTSLVSIDIPDSVTTMSAIAFRNCTNLAEVGYPAGWTTTLSSLDRSPSDPGSDEYASPFTGCTALKTIEVPEGVTFIPSNAFRSCHSLEQIILPESLERIDDYAFYKSTGLKELALPGGVTAIGDRAFSGCTGLTELELNEGLSSTGNYVFDGCTGLTSVTIPQTLTELNTGIFKDCTGISKLVLPEGLSVIGVQAFRNCVGLNYVTLPDSLESIGSMAFSSCTGLRMIDFNPGLSSIGGSAFNDCTGLESVFMTCALTAIPASAFSDCTSLKDVLLPSGLKTIGNYAFQNCAGIAQLDVPSSVTTISGSNTFSGVPDLVFYCDLNSYAATYAIDHDIPIVDTGDYADSDKLHLDRENSYYRVNSDGISASGHLSMVAKYTLKEAAAASAAKLTFSIPDSVSLVESTLTVDGAVCTDYSCANGTLTVPVSANSTVVRFLLKPLSYDRVEVYSGLSFSDGTTEIVGVVYTELPLLSINVPEETSETTIKISGVTVPESYVTLSVNGVEADTVQANKIGDYVASVSLDDPVNGKAYTIQALNRDYGTTVEDMVAYWDSTPVLTQFVMEYGANTYDLRDSANLSPRVVWRNSSDYRFTIGFRNAEGIEAVFVVGNRSNMKKSIPAVWDEALQLYVAEGFFGDDQSYLPTSIGVAYVHKDGEFSFEEGFDFTSEEARNSIPQAWRDAEVTVYENTETRTDVLIEQDASGEGSLHVVTEVQEIPEGFTPEQAEALGYTEVTDSQGNIAYIQSCIENGKQVVKTIYLKTQQTVITTAEVVNAYVDASGVKGFKVVGTIGDCLDVLKMTEIGVGGISDLYDYANMKQQVYDSSLPAADKQEAIDQLNDAVVFSTLASVTRVQLVALGSLALPMVGAALGPLGIAAMMVCLGAAEMSIDALQGIVMEQMQELLSVKFAWMIDPSGYVYDAETAERIQGATVTVYWMPYDETDETYWDAPPAEDEYGEKWDASEWSQRNPLTTDIEGRYAWDVPEGWWRVKCEHADYATNWSQWLPVPPPQLEVNIAMTPVNRYVVGDFDNDGQVTDGDVALLLWHTLFADMYPIGQNGDLNGDGNVTDEDVAYLLWHTLFPDLYPLG